MQTGQKHFEKCPVMASEPPLKLLTKILHPWIFVLLWNFSCMLKIVQNKPLHQWLISVSDTIFANLNFSFDDKKAITCSSIRCHSCTQLISAECDSQGRFNLSYLFLKSWDKEKLLTHFFFCFLQSFLQVILWHRLTLVLLLWSQLVCRML